MRKNIFLAAALSAAFSFTTLPPVCAATVAPADALPSSDVVWTTPSEDSRGSMPLGNGDIGLNVWVEKSTGDLLFYISKTDAWSSSLYGPYSLLKLGRLRVHLTPQVSLDGDAAFTQTLRLADGDILIRRGQTGSPGAVTLRVWVDANQPVVRVEIDSARTPITAQARLESWRIGPENGLQADTILTDRRDRLAWYYRNGPEGSPAVVNRTFGAIAQGDGWDADGSGTLLQTTAPRKHAVLSVYPYTAQTPTPEAWLMQTEAQAAQVDKTAFPAARAKHEAWWKQFWDRSYIVVSGNKDADRVTQGYALQRFVSACAGRGAYPLKFNGSIFTVDYHAPQTVDGVKKTVPVSADYRTWGGRYWFQNTRAMYWPMLAAGDFEMMRPLFQMYRNILPNNLKQVREFYGHDGAYFVEAKPFTGGIDRITETTVANTGSHYFSPILELSTLLLDNWAYTGDRTLVRETLIPIADAGLTYYDQHYKPGADGKLRIEPVNALETYWKSTNPAPDIAGLQRVVSGLLALPDDLTDAAARERWRGMESRLPDLPRGTKEGQTVLLPAEIYGKPGNVENPELYAVYPYRLFGVGKPDLALARATFAARLFRQDGCWTQNSIDAAFLGETAEARRGVVASFTYQDAQRQQNNDLRFRAFWGPGHDYVPDQDQGGNAMLTLQLMLMQCDGAKIRLLPAWPADWNADFKLHAPQNTVVEASVRAGKLQRLRVTPSLRRSDVEIILSK